MLFLQVRGYKLEQNGMEMINIFGFEVVIPYGQPWTSARFRWKNNQGCGTECSPRCVEIERNGEISDQDVEENLVYDCELGLYHGAQAAISTGGSTYTLDICLDKSCKSFIVRMPKPTDPFYNSDGIPLVETNELHKGNLIIHFPKGENAEQFLGLKYHCIIVIVLFYQFWKEVIGQIYCHAT